MLHHSDFMEASWEMAWQAHWQCSLLNATCIIKLLSTLQSLHYGHPPPKTSMLLTLLFFPVTHHLKDLIHFSGVTITTMLNHFQMYTWTWITHQSPNLWLRAGTLTSLSQSPHTGVKKRNTSQKELFHNGMSLPTHHLGKLHQCSPMPQTVWALGHSF